MVTHAEATELHEARHSKLADRVDFDAPEFGGEESDSRVTVYDGDLRIDGDFSVGPDPVLVLGSLEVTGWLSDGTDADATILVVTGSVKADRVMLWSKVSIGEDLDVKTLVYANSLNDYSLYVGGNLRAGALVEEGTYCEIAGAVESPLVLSVQNAIVHGPSRKAVVPRRGRPASDVFRPEFLDDGYPNQDRIAEAMKSGKPVLRA
jgi:hypothetical protein